jgi:DNA-binding MarR family transcriptional regulator
MPDDVNAKITAALERLAVALHKSLWDAAYAQDLSATQAQMLLYLISLDDSEVSMSELASRFGLTLPTVSDAVRSLVEKGLVEQRRAPRDGRIRVVALTPAGRRRARHLQHWADAIRQQVAALDPNTKGTFLACLLDLIARLQRAGLVSLTRQCQTCLYFQPHRYSNPDAPHHCGLLNQPLHLTELRLHCPDHTTLPANP